MVKFIAAGSQILRNPDDKKETFDSLAEIRDS